jgi:hypothetical protein
LISRTEERHTHVQWLRFLKQIDRKTPKELEVHLILDNYATHKHETVLKWLSRRPRSSWMNLVERFFGELTSDVIRDGSFTAVRQLARDIAHYIAERNLRPRPYVWNAKGEDILRKIESAREALSQIRAERDDPC